MIFNIIILINNKTGNIDGFEEKNMKPIRWLLLSIAILGITLLALFLRMYASDKLYYDHDEDTYLSAALNYTNYMREGKLNWLAWDTTNFEHPSFNKIIYGLALLSEDPLSHFNKSDFAYNMPISNSQAYEYAIANRRVSVIFGSLTVLALSILNPLAGFFLAINSLCIKYTSEIYLEALPMFTSLLSVIAFGKYVKISTHKTTKDKKPLLWLGASAVFLGITAASKYVFCVAGLSIAIYWMRLLIRRKLYSRHIFYFLGWGIASIFFFFVFNPYLWPHPVERFIGTFAFHLNFQEADFVKVYPFWQVIKWLFNPFAEYDPAPYSAFLFRVEPVIFILAIIGLPRTLRKNSLFAVWLLIGLLFLLVWGTKWPQYTMIILVPFSVAAAQGCISIFELAKSLLIRKKNAIQSESKPFAGDSEES
jgi:hypothetical protein